VLLRTTTLTHGSPGAPKHRQCAAHIEVLRHWPRPTLFTNALPDKVIFWESESELVQPAKKLVIRKISFLCKTLIPFRVSWGLLQALVPSDRSSREKRGDLPNVP